MKKLITAICLVCTLILTSSCETYAQVYHDVPHTYEYYYDNRPVVLINNIYYCRLFVDNHWVYRPIPMEYWHHIEHSTTRHHNNRHSHHYYRPPMPHRRPSSGFHGSSRTTVHQHKNNGLQGHRNTNIGPKPQRHGRR